MQAVGLVVSRDTVSLAGDAIAPPYPPLPPTGLAPCTSITPLASPLLHLPLLSHTSSPPWRFKLLTCYHSRGKKTRLQHCKECSRAVLLLILCGGEKKREHTESRQRARESQTRRQSRGGSAEQKQKQSRAEHEPHTSSTRPSSWANRLARLS